jgi:energy-coupling factor transporter ATP-binding protein EcfA2
MNQAPERFVRRTVVSHARECNTYSDRSELVRRMRERMDRECKTVFDTTSLLFICGPEGCGKTTMLRGILNRKRCNPMVKEIYYIYAAEAESEERREKRIMNFPDAVHVAVSLFGAPLDVDSLVPYSLCVVDNILDERIINTYKETCTMNWIHLVTSHNLHIHKKFASRRRPAVVLFRDTTISSTLDYETNSMFVYQRAPYTAVVSHLIALPFRDPQPLHTAEFPSQIPAAIDETANEKVKENYTVRDCIIIKQCHQYLCEYMTQSDQEETINQEPLLLDLVFGILQQQADFMVRQSRRLVEEDPATNQSTQPINAL